jgi:signal peptidase I
MWKVLRITAWTLLILGALVGVLRLTCIRWWQLPLSDPYFEASVAPSLRGGDWVLLWRATAPAFGDLVLCPEPKTNRPVIGRIIAEGGDHLKIDGANVTINNHAIETETACDRFRVHDPASGAEVDQGCAVEVVGSHTHIRGNAPAELLKSFDTEVDVPRGQVFLFSDNREFPYDSRQFGVVDRSTCIETVFFRLLSKDGFFDVPNRLSLIH